MSKLSTALLVVLAALAVASGGACRRADATRPDARPDRVTITTPQDQAMFAAGDDITVEVRMDIGEAVQRVEFWSNGGVLRTLDRPPFRTTIPKAGAGSYRIHAVAYTAHGKIASPQVYVGVRMREEDRMHELTAEEAAGLIGGADPHIFVNAPTSDQMLKAPADVTIDGWVAFPAAAIKQVRVLADGKLLTAVTTPTFTHVWERVPKGRHTIVIQAMDAEGRTSTRTVILDVR